jgi:hypothetical protein
LNIYYIIPTRSVNVEAKAKLVRSKQVSLSWKKLAEVIVPPVLAALVALFRTSRGSFELKSPARSYLYSASSRRRRMHAAKTPNARIHIERFKLCFASFYCGGVFV